MIVSMSGSGFVSNRYKGVTYNIYIKSLNNKYLNFSTNLPNEINFIEADLLKILKKHFRRGRISLNICIDYNKDFAGERVNRKAMNSYLKTLNALSQKLENKSVNTCIDLAGILSLSGVLIPLDYGDKDFVNKVRADVIRCVNKTFVMKIEEGRYIEGQFHKTISKISELLQRVERLKNRYENLDREEFSNFLSFISQKNVLSEKDLIDLKDLYINQRKGIREEINRLKSHLNQVELELNKKTISSGKKLEFLINEMHREFYTILSKFRKKKMINVVINIMECLDDLKEQVQNIE